MSARTSPGIFRRHLAVAAIAATAAAMVSGLAGAPASARPVNPELGWQNSGATDTVRLQRENAQLKSDLSAYQSAYTELTNGLDNVERANGRNRDRGARRAIQRAIDDTLDRTGRYVGTGDDAYPDGPGGGWHDRDHRDRDRNPPPIAAAVTAADFAALSTSVQNAHFADDQLGLIRTAAATNLFTADQVVALMKLTAFDETRVQIAATLKPRLIDPVHWYHVYDAFSFSSSKDDLRKLVGE